MALDHIGYGYGGFSQPNPYGYLAQGGYYPNYYANQGGFYNNPFGQGQVDQQQQKAQKDANTSFFTKLFSRFSDSNHPSKQTNKLMNPNNPFEMNGNNFYNPYQFGHTDFGKAQKQK
jgi:hypothetical protein